MKTLKFNKKYYLPILNGDKTQTLRDKNKRLNEGEIVKAVFPGTGLECKIRVLKTGYKQFKYIDEEDAKREGFHTIGELENELERIYHNIDQFTRLYYIRFKVL